MLAFMTRKDQISIACASAFWGDTPYAVPQLLNDPELNYICFDYLSEVTMTLLARIKKKDPKLGYIQDFLTDVVTPHLKTCIDRKIKLISNAGALNPTALKHQIDEIAKAQGLNVKVVCVMGDDLLSASNSISKGPQRITDLEGKSWTTDSFLTANAYLGAPAIVEALKLDADIVITGRTVDTALALAPLVFEFDWSWEDFDKLAQGSLAGHIVECGTQCTGGNFTDWSQIPQSENVGFPIIRANSDSSFKITKAPNTGGLVSPATIAEQIVYEIGDPKHYLLPDVICDFTHVQLESLNGNEVKVMGARGRAPSPHYKVSATMQDGWKLSTAAVMKGGNVQAKGTHLNQSLIQRAQNLLAAEGLLPFTEVISECLGEGDTTVLRVSAAHTDFKALEILAKEVAPSATSLMPGLTSLLGGRARPSPRIALVSYLIEKDQVQPQIFVDQKPVDIKVPKISKPFSAPTRADWNSPLKASSTRPRVKLEQLAYARSGDKGNDVNIGVIARSPTYLDVLKEQLTPSRVAEFFQSDFDDHSKAVVLAWELPGINALNFLLKDCLGGGGSYSLKSDPQGKAYAQRLLQLPVYFEGEL